MGFFKEFKEFAMKGNVMDMAIGVIIGGAFGKIVTSLVNDILMPLIGALIGNVDFTTLSVTLREAVMEGDEVVDLPPLLRHCDVQRRRRRDEQGLGIADDAFVLYIRDRRGLQLFRGDRHLALPRQRLCELDGELGGHLRDT